VLLITEDGKTRSSLVRILLSLRTRSMISLLETYQWRHYEGQLCNP